jgi:2'-5' RNA ligase
VARFRDRVPLARWTRSDGWHVTLKFLGTTWPRLVETVREAVAAAAAEANAFPSAVTELGVFPSPGRARVIWAGLSDPDGRFAALAKRLDDLLAEDFDVEERPFTPHLTLARLNPPRDIREFAPDLVGAPVASERFEVDRLVLYQSRLSPKGATYQPLMETRLAG